MERFKECKWDGIEREEIGWNKAKELGNERYESGCGEHVLIEIKTNTEQIGGTRREIKEKGRERERKGKKRKDFIPIKGIESMDVTESQLLTLLKLLNPAAGFTVGAVIGSPPPPTVMR